MSNNPILAKTSAGLSPRLLAYFSFNLVQAQDLIPMVDEEVTSFHQSPHQMDNAQHAVTHTTNEGDNFLGAIHCTMLASHQVSTVQANHDTGFNDFNWLNLDVDEAAALEAKAYRDSRQNLALKKWSAIEWRPSDGYRRGASDSG